MMMGGVWARMLYDHVEDPGETVNIAERPEAQAIVAQHQQMLEQGWSA
ncbi:MAG: hypothetical protein HLUCCO16_05360 [Phormidium sp. OSCR]|nr:MAG: hypothetical protein HLUCCO16_05360 [Phormidium sp. OSCR]